MLELLASAWSCFKIKYWSIFGIVQRTTRATTRDIKIAKNDIYERVKDIVGSETRFRKTDVVFYFKNVYSFKDVCFWNKDVCLFRPASSFKWFQFLAFSALKKIFDGRLMRSKLATERNDSHS